FRKCCTRVDALKANRIVAVCGAIFYSKKAKNGVLRVNFGAVGVAAPDMLPLARKLLCYDESTEIRSGSTSMLEFHHHKEPDTTSLAQLNQAADYHQHSENRRS